MLRRHFLTGGAGAVLAAGGGGRAGAGESVTVAVASLRIAGVPASRVVGLMPGEPLVLQRAPQDRFDPLAILALGRGGPPIGRLPGGECWILARLMDAGLALEGRVVAILQGGRGAAIKMDVWLNEPA